MGIFLSTRSGGDSHRDDSGRQVVHNDGPRAYGCPCSDRDARAAGGSDAQERAIIDASFASEMAAGSHVHVVAESAVVVHSCGGVHDRVTADDRVGLDYGS